MLVKGRTSVYDFNFHLVFVTKYRQPIFNTDEMQAHVENMIRDIAADNEITIQNMTVMPDYVHCLISFPPKLSASVVVKTIKGGVGRRWFKHFPDTKDTLWGGHLWSPSFFMSTLGDMSKDIVDAYIDSHITEYNAGRPRR